LPCVYWTQGVETAPSLKQAGIERLCVPPEQLAAWQQAHAAVAALSSAELEAREALATPGITGFAPTVSATRSPWVFANGWRFLRRPGGKYRYDLPAGKAVLAAAEAFTYGADAVLRVDAADLAELGRMLGFLASVPSLELPAVADFGVVDDGSSQVGEVMNLLVRRNLLFSILDAPQARFRINLQLGSPDYPRAEAADPSALALKVRRQLSDGERALRLYGTEGVIARLTADAGRARLFLLNYGGGRIDDLRVRVRGPYTEGTALVTGSGQVPLEEVASGDGSMEFSLSQLGRYAVIDLKTAAPRQP